MINIIVVKMTMIKLINGALVCQSTVFFATLDHGTRLILLHELFVDLRIFRPSIGRGVVVDPRICLVLSNEMDLSLQSGWWL